MKMDHWITPYQASLQLRVDTNTVLGYIRDGKLRASHLSGGNIPYIHRDELNRFLREDWPHLPHPIHAPADTNIDTGESSPAGPRPEEDRRGILRRALRRVKGLSSSQDGK